MNKVFAYDTLHTNQPGFFSNGTQDNTSNYTVIYLDEYIENVLPSHLQKIFLENIPENERLQEYEGDEESSNPPKLAIKNNESINKYVKLLQFLDGQRVYDGSNSIQSSSFSSWSFIEGFIIGQLSVILILVFFIKFFIFSENKPSSDLKNNSKSVLSSSSSSSNIFSLPNSEKDSFMPHQFFSSIVKRGGKTHFEIENENENEVSGASRRLNTILKKAYYDVDTHPAESLDWFNVLIAQTIQQFREEAWQKDNIVHSLNNFIQNKSEELPKYLDDIKITELDIGNDFPIFSNCRIQYSPNSNKKKLEAKIDIDLNDRLAFGIETRLLLNYPKPVTAVLPVNLTVAIVKFQACLTVSLTNAEDLVPTNKNLESDSDNSGYFLMFSFAPEYTMEFDTKSLIGARSKLENIPKISSLIEYHIKKWFVERCVEPRFQCVKLPNIWPRSKNAREEKVDVDDTDSIKTET